VKTLEQMAAKLSAAQRRVMSGPAREIGNPVSTILIDEWLIYDRRAIPTRTKLSKLGLIESGRFGPTMLTTLGLEVRAILQEQADAK
jgi:hypothetical protein